MKDLVKYIVDTLTGDADVTVEYADDKPTEIVISASKDDIGKVIGKQGRIAKSIRTIVKAASGKQGKHKFYTVSIVKKDGDNETEDKAQE